ncbi:Formate dehydrogenase O beta subunit [Candidatus Syntrophocurvum alkaliphilum]|uniref:Formate dehydrogenase O beta subunit n=1 Tax=Candidatus Syntrophocurvum alkaliphilum TaxID=2293317 RepID=A0A6I6DCK6_9FIRM|nr:4Fe-4S dicluster domain-containing protein [Candidatus Syntrophocurvum alkaliphilum]QGT99104.1 Formate dehydrogenase O beta subunit [Candidatus Syntrophocurvum alkaliphilum]
MARMANLYDVSKCTACRGCMVACKDWNKLPAVIKPFKGNYSTHEDVDPDTYTIVKFIEHEDALEDIQWNFLKYQCMHCSDPVCKKVCPSDAFFITEWGAVIKDSQKCVSCRYCEYSCPFMVPKYSGREDMVTKCTYCYDRVENGATPACSRTCPTGALTFGERHKLLVQAEERVKYLRANGYPNATIYGRHELGGLNKLYVLTDTPDKFDLPVNPTVSGTVGFWQDIVQPYFGWLMPLALAGSAVSFVTTRLLQNKSGDHGEGGHE